MMTTTQPTAIGVLTSGGDAPGMNAALRAVVRTGIARGARVFAIQEGYQGMVAGGNLIRELRWGDVGGILQRGGTVIGTARCAEFRTREGRLRAAKNLVERGIDRLVVIGGDGSLTGADTFRREWASLLGELTETVVITAAQAAAHPALGVVGLVGSIDNDFSRTDMTIGADTALHRITAAIDDLSSTAASHQCTFVIEAMGRHCGYLALMGGVSGGADWVFIPENPPASDDWPAQMCEVIRAGREAGRRDSIIIVAEGAQDRHGNPIASAQVQSILKERLGVDTRVTILGHVQRGGSPSAFDRWMSTLVGYAAIDDLLDSPPEAEPQVIGVRYNRIRRTPLMEAVEATRAVGAAITAQEYDTAMGLRGGSFTEMFGIFQAMAYALPSVDRPRPRRIGILNAGGPAPGMNTAVRAAVRLALDQGHAVTGIYNGFEGLIDGQVEEFNWGSVDGWGPRGGSELGTSRRLPIDAELAAVARTIETHKIAALLVIGGWTSYVGAAQLEAARDRYPAFNIPILCLPATIDNNLPGSELSIGADTALNSIVEAVDKIRLFLPIR
jgi:6-phosphofructokinase 1